MTSDSAFVLMAVAVAISSIALLALAVAAAGVYRSVRRIEREVLPLVPKTARNLELGEKTLTTALSQIEQLSAKAHVFLDASQREIEVFSKTRGEFTDRLRIQAERLDLVMEDSLGRLQEVVNVVHGSVMKPVREVSGILAGVKTAFQTFVRGRRPSVDRATHDEEMFI